MAKTDEKTCHQCGETIEDGGYQVVEACNFETRNGKVSAVDIDEVTVCTECYEDDETVKHCYVTKVFFLTDTCDYVYLYDENEYALENAANHAGYWQDQDDDWRNPGTSSFTCDSCDRQCAGDLYLLLSGFFEVKQVGSTFAFIDPETDEYCEHCWDDMHTPECCVTGETFDPDSVDYINLEDEECSDAVKVAVGCEYPNYIIQAVADLLGIVYDEDSSTYIIKEGAQTVANSNCVDFYWRLQDGVRKGVLQLDGGDEMPMGEPLEKKIFTRIDEHGADHGDPQVVNTYSVLVLKEDGLLPQEYTL